MRGAAEGEEPVRLGIGIEPEALHGCDSGSREPRGNVGLKIELVMPGPAGPEE